MRDRWDSENALIPLELALDVSRPAVLLYVYALAYSDSTGFCDRLKLAGARAGLTHSQIKKAMAELEKFKYIEIVLLPGEYGGIQTACKLTQYKTPMRQERLNQEAWQALRTAVFKRDDYTCQYCGERGGDLECDHVEPISAGGTNEMGNLITACGPCNRNKRAKKLESWAGRQLQ